jgi:YVTN family beta-propeller protein
MKVLRAVVCLAVASFLMIEVGCGNQYRPVANPVPSPGGQPAKVHFAWSVNFNPSGGPGSTTEIDVSGDTNLAVNNMGVGSVAEAFPPSSVALFVANRDNDTVSEYLPTLSGPVTTISLLAGSHPVYVKSARAGFMYVLNSGANSACPNGGSVSAIPSATLSVTGTACVGPNPTIMAQSSVNSFLYVLNQDGTVSVVDGSGTVPSLVGTITTANGLGQNPSTVTTSPDGNWIFVATQGDGVGPGTLDIIAAGATSVAASVPLGVRPTFAIPDTTLNRLYVVNSGDNTVSVFDTSNVNPSGSPPIPLLATAAVGTTPIGLTPLADGTKFYVANSGSNDVTVVSASSFSTLTTIPLPSGANPVFMASDPTSSKVYVADPGISATTIIQTSNNTVTMNLPAPTQIAGCTSNCALQQPLMVVAQ